MYGFKLLQAVVSWRGKEKEKERGRENFFGWKSGLDTRGCAVYSINSEL